MSEIINHQDLGKVKYCMFFPSEQNEAKLVEFLKLAKEELHISIFAFTNSNLANAIFEAVEKHKVKVRIICDDDQMDNPYSLVQTLKSASHQQIEARHDGNRKSHMHNKYLILDHKYVLTGSFNWTAAAVKSNKENLVILEGKDIVEQYIANFESLWEEFKDNAVDIKNLPDIKAKRANKMENHDEAPKKRQKKKKTDKEENDDDQEDNKEKKPRAKRQPRKKKTTNDDNKSEKSEKEEVTKAIKKERVPRKATQEQKEQDNDDEDDDFADEDKESKGASDDSFKAEDD